MFIFISKGFKLGYSLVINYNPLGLGGYGIKRMTYIFMYNH
jgi:hypothetical protein